MKKKRCNHIRDDYMPVPAGYSKKDFQKQSKGGLDPYTETRIRDFVSYFCATNIPDNEALFLIEKQFGIKILKATYHKHKQAVLSNVEVQTWLNSYAKIGFVAAHIQDIERTKMMSDKIVSAYQLEMAKEHEERNYQLTSSLVRDYEKLTKLNIVLRAGAPVLARIKAMIDASNIRAVENDPTMLKDEKQQILSKKGRKTFTVMTVPNTMTEDDTDLTVVSKCTDNTHMPDGAIRGKAIEYNNGNIIKKSDNLTSPQDNSSLESEEPDSVGKQDIERKSDSGSEFIQFLMEESKSDDIIPKRIRSSLNLDTKG